MSDLSYPVREKEPVKIKSNGPQNFDLIALQIQTICSNHFYLNQMLIFLYSRRQLTRISTTCRNYTI